MAKPSETELGMALHQAKQMRENSEDPYFIAKALLNAHYQTQYLQEVLQLAEEYLRSGLSEQVHMRLQKAIEKAKSVDARSAHKEDQALGL